MNSKKQQSATSSETSSSSSSNSSSSSSSSSGSDSSSSDSEGSSSSQNSNNKSGAENGKTTPKRATKPVQSNVKAKKPEEKKPPPPKQSPVKKGAAIYSSESDESTTKPSPVKRRLSTTKPKVSATVPVGQKSSKANARPTRNAKNEPTPKATIDKGNKKTKARSIFSPDNSSESENEKDSKPSSLRGSTRNLSKSAPSNKVKENDVKKDDRRNTKSSASASSSDSSDSSSDSDSSESSSANNKSKPKGSDKQDSEKTESENSRNQTKSKTSESSEVESNKRGVVTRKLTRSSSARRSKHLTGKLGTDTESETETKMSKQSGKKQSGPKGPISRNKNCKGLPSKTAMTHCDIVEERKCPMEGCNSMGHLGGCYDKHFTIDACPMYHNKTVEECKEMYEERMRKEEERKKAMMSMSRRSPKNHSHHLGSDQRAYQLMVKDIRSKFQEKGEMNDVKCEEKDREPILDNIASEYDLRLFQEAQAAASEKIEDDLKALPNIKQTKYIEMGRFEMEVWYQSPYPDDYARLPKLYLCEYCLKYMKSRTILKRHVIKCVWRHPPGEEVYRKERLSVWEVDGKRYKQYCQNLCLLAKFFLDHKTLYYDVEPFLFYVMTISDSEGCHTVGYFSKEKNSFLNYNVSCILTLPPYQRQGYGRLLIDFSYLLTREEGKIGSPEKPLSDLGLISYRSYWKDVLLEYLCKFGGKEISIKDISQEMAINSYDIVSTLQALGMMKYWKGKHIILKKQDEIEEYNDRVKRRDFAHKEIDKKFLKWIPFTPSQPQNSS